MLLAGCLRITLATVMSVMSLPHAAYLASMMFPLAALRAIVLWRVARQGTSPLRFAVPITTAVQTGWMLVLVMNYPAFAKWLQVPMAVLGFRAASLLLAYVSHRLRVPKLGRIGALADLTGALLGPLGWS